MIWEEGNVATKYRIWTITHISIQRRSHIHLIFLLIKAWMAPQMTPHYKPREQLVFHRINAVLHHTQYIEPRQNRLRQLDVLLKRNRRIIPASDRIRCGNDSTTCLQRRDDACFGYGDRLLLHGFVDGCSVCVVHFVKFVNETGSLVCQYQRSAFQSPLPRHGILAHACSQTDRRGTLASGEY